MRYAITTEAVPGGSMHHLHKTNNPWDREVWCYAYVDAIFMRLVLNELSDEAYDRLRREAIAEANRKLEAA